MNQVFAIITSLVSLVTPQQLEIAEFCQAMGGVTYSVDTQECVIVTVVTDAHGNEQAFFETYQVTQEGQ